MIDKKKLENYITNEMKKFYYERTNMHIGLVKKYLNKLINFYNDNLTSYELQKRSMNHDNSKFFEPLLTPYIILSWNYKNKKETGKDLDYYDQVANDINQATEIHVKSERHHPEYHSDQENLINPKDRDKPLVLVDATKMNKFDIMEMVADWCAMSEEKNTDPFDWAKNNINIRWKFTDIQEKLIYELLEILWSNK